MTRRREPAFAMIDESRWVPDLVLPDCDATVITLGRAEDGDLAATLVRRLAAAPSRRAVLYLHGFVDYFFQAHVAQAFAEFGWDFYALDLRRHGRSLRAGNRPNYCTDLAEYDAEIGAALDLIREEEHETVVLLGHSTGGLAASLYAARGAERARVSGVALNSPFFRFSIKSARRFLLPVAAALGAVLPWGADPSGLSPRYGESLLAEHHGEWTYDTRWKPVRGFPIYFGWVRAIRAAQATVQRGLGLTCPVLLLHSSGSMTPGPVWIDEYLRHDIVLDVDDMRRTAPRLGSDVTIREIPDGLHDLFLSPSPARDQALGATLAWLDARFPAAVVPFTSEASIPQ
jgi:alpha-beta hydrolase superfamily lysophospholipase